MVEKSASGVEKSVSGGYTYVCTYKTVFNQHKLGAPNILRASDGGVVGNFNSCMLGERWVLETFSFPECLKVGW